MNVCVCIYISVCVYKYVCMYLCDQLSQQGAVRAAVAGVGNIPPNESNSSSHSAGEGADKSFPTIFKQNN